MTELSFQTYLGDFRAGNGSVLVGSVHWKGEFHNVFGGEGTRGKRKKPFEK